MSWHLFPVGLIGCVFLGTASAAETLTLVEQGKARVCVVVPAKAIPAKGAAADPAFEHHRLAAKDLADYLGKMSGAMVTVSDKPATGLVPIYAGSAPAKIALTKKSDFGDAYLIDVRSDQIVLDGESGHSVRYAASRLLNLLGVRWCGWAELSPSGFRSKVIRATTGGTSTEATPVRTDRGG